MIAQDSAGANSSWSAAHAIAITLAPTITIAIKGGLGVTANITNSGAAAITANWTIDLSGGLIILGKHKANSHSIAAGGSYNAKDFVLGFGSTTITATANGVTKTATAKVILIFVTGVA